MKKLFLLIIIFAAIVTFSSCIKPCLNGIYHKNVEIKKLTNGNILIPLDINNDSINDLFLESSLRDAEYFFWKKGANPNSDLIVYLRTDSFSNHLTIYDVLLPTEKRKPTHQATWGLDK